MQRQFLHTPPTADITSWSRERQTSRRPLHLLQRTQHRHSPPLGALSTREQLGRTQHRSPPRHATRIATTQAHTRPYPPHPQRTQHRNSTVLPLDTPSGTKRRQHRNDNHNNSHYTDLPPLFPAKLHRSRHIDARTQHHNADTEHGRGTQETGKPQTQAQYQPGTPPGTTAPFLFLQ